LTFYKSSGILSMFYRRVMNRTHTVAALVALAVLPSRPISVQTGNDSSREKLVVK
jgi:hypothetical protein